MMQGLNLKEIERKAWRSTFQDGLYDLFLGWLVLWLGVIYLLSKSDLQDWALTVINLGVYTLSAILLFLAKRLITVPRVGRVQFGPRRRSRLRMVVLITFTMVALTFSLTLLSVVRQRSLFGETLAPLVSPFLLGLFFLIFFSVAAFFLEYKRLYLIGVMFAVPEPALAVFQQFWGIHLGFLAFAVPAVVVIIIGLVVLLRFLREYPVPAIPSGEMKP